MQSLLVLTIIAVLEGAYRSHRRRVDELNATHKTEIAGLEQQSQKQVNQIEGLNQELTGKTEQITNLKQLLSESENQVAELKEARKSEPDIKHNLSYLYPVSTLAV